LKASDHGAQHQPNERILDLASPNKLICGGEMRGLSRTSIW
jgi:hypothetical protein